MSHRFRVVQLAELDAEREFALQAAERFQDQPDVVSFGDIQPGAFFAIRWGLTDRGVMVMKLDPDHIPANYHELVPYNPEAHQCAWTHERAVTGYVNRTGCGHTVPLVNGASRWEFCPRCGKRISRRPLEADSD